MKSEILNANGEKPLVYPCLLKKVDSDMVLFATNDHEKSKEHFDGFIVKHNNQSYIGHKTCGERKEVYELFDGKVVLSN